MANDGIIVYVGPSVAIKTIAEGRELMRDGYPDQMLLERGATFAESLGHWKVSGRSKEEPMVIGSFGSALARPQLLTGALDGILTAGGGGSPATIDNLVIEGLAFFPDAYTGTQDCVGARFLRPGQHITIEDCEFKGYAINIVIQGFGGRHFDFAVRRSIIIDAWTIKAQDHSQGLYASNIDTLLLEENLFDHNGWNEAVAGAQADVYSHNVYIDNDCSDVVVAANIIARGSSHGLQLRCGGDISHNLFADNAIALNFGGGNYPDPQGVYGRIFANVIIGGRDIDAQNPRGWAVWIGNTAACYVSSNVICNNTLGTQPQGIILAGNFIGDNAVRNGVHGVTIIENTIYNWGGSIRIEGNDLLVTKIALIDNNVQNNVTADPLVLHELASSALGVNSVMNKFYSVAPKSEWMSVEDGPMSLEEWLQLVRHPESSLMQVLTVANKNSTGQKITYKDPTRSIASYNALLGGTASIGAFMVEARKQSAYNWLGAYTIVPIIRYIRAGLEPA